MSAPDTGEIAPPADRLEALASRLLAVVREGCWCASRRKPCEVHDAYEDGLLAALDAFQHVGWMGPYGIVPGGLDVDPAPHWRPLYMADSGRNGVDR